MLSSRHDFDCFTSSADSLLVLEGVTTPTTVAIGVDGLELPLRLFIFVKLDLEIGVDGLELPLRVFIFVKLDMVQDQLLLKADEGDSRR